MKKVIFLDIIDKQILAILSKDAKLTNKEIGKLVHMSGQAVGQRIANLKENNIIDHFSININYSDTQFIRIFMDSNKYKTFEEAVNSFEGIETFVKTSGQACYTIISHFSEEKLKQFIETISPWCRYTVETVVADKKQG